MTSVASLRDGEGLHESVDGVDRQVPVVIGLALDLNLRSQRLGRDVSPLHAVCRGEGRLLGLLLAPVPAPLLAVELVGDGRDGGGTGGSSRSEIRRRRG